MMALLSLATKRYSSDVSRFLPVLAAAVFSSCSVPHLFTKFVRTSEQMTWRHSPEDKSREHPDLEPVVLSFVKAPEHEQVLFSPELLQRLQRLGKPVVDVEFEVWSEFGRFKGYRIVSIAGVPYFGTSDALDAAREWVTVRPRRRNPVEAVFPP
jgi:hypothetical protein